MPRVTLDDRRLAAIEVQVQRMQAMLPKVLRELSRLRALALAQRPAQKGGTPSTLHEAQRRAERECLLAVGERAKWNRSEMARVLGVDRKSVYRRLHQHGLFHLGEMPGGRHRRRAGR
jgi:transcriptional regulator of acetoin/glycerol metabolism